MRKANGTNKKKNLLSLQETPKKKEGNKDIFQEQKYNHCTRFGSLVNNICHCSPTLIQFILEQRKFEPHGSTYTLIAFNKYILQFYMIRTWLNHGYTRTTIK